LPAQAIRFVRGRIPLQRRARHADDVGMQGPIRIEQRRRVRRGERTLVVRVIEYPAPRDDRSARSSATR